MVFLSSRNGNLQIEFYVLLQMVLLKYEFKPRANKLISIMELWMKTKRNSVLLNEWITKVYNMVEPFLNC